MSVERKAGGPGAVTLEEACAELSARVYEATTLLERLEGAGHLLGNGHHARQEIARLAVGALKSRWR